MKKDMLRRLARLEAILDKRTPKKVDERSEPELGLQVIVAFHAGKLSGGESLATAFARGLRRTSRSKPCAASPEIHDWRVKQSRASHQIEAGAGSAHQN
jgi:hypothetical protein